MVIIPKINGVISIFGSLEIIRDLQNDKQALVFSWWRRSCRRIRNSEISKMTSKRAPQLFSKNTVSQPPRTYTQWTRGGKGGTGRRGRGGGGGGGGGRPSTNRWRGESSTSATQWRTSGASSPIPSSCADRPYDQGGTDPASQAAVLDGPRGRRGRRERTAGDLGRRAARPRSTSAAAVVAAVAAAAVVPAVRVDLDRVDRAAHVPQCDAGQLFFFDAGPVLFHKLFDEHEQSLIVRVARLSPGFCGTMFFVF